MKLIVYSLAIAAACMTTACCTSNKKQGGTTQTSEVKESKGVAVQVPVKDLSGYFLKNTYQFKGNIDLIYIKDQSQFDSLFGMAKTMNNKIESPDFTSNSVMAVAMQPTNAKTDMKVESVIKEGNKLNIRVTLNKGAEQSFTQSPVISFSLPKDPSVTQAQLYVNGEESTKINL